MRRDVHNFPELFEAVIAMNATPLAEPRVIVLCDLGGMTCHYNLGEHDLTLTRLSTAQRDIELGVVS